MMSPFSRLLLVVAGCVAAAVTAVPAQGPAPQGTIRTVVLPQPGAPLVAVRLMLRVGSIHDPAGKEGLAALTGLMVGRAGTRRHSFAELLEAQYPMAADIGVNTDREVTVFSGETHRETLDQYTTLLTEVLLEPAFNQTDFERNREQLVAYLTSTLRSANDELLGLEAIQQRVFGGGHPYGHSPSGTVEALKRITLDDVRQFYAEHYTKANLILGVAGGYPSTYVAQLQSALGKLPELRQALRCRRRLRSRDDSSRSLKSRQTLSESTSRIRCRWGAGTRISIPCSWPTAFSASTAPFTDG
jgi:zinc protease